MTGTINGKFYEQILPHHECTDADYEQFYSIKEQFRQGLNDIRESPDRGFLCIDWEQGDEDFYSLYGDLSSDSRMLEAIMAPCNYRHTEIDESGLEVDTECITDRKEQF